MTVTEQATEATSEVRTGPDGDDSFDPSTGKTVKGSELAEPIRRAVGTAILSGPPDGEPRPNDTRVRCFRGRNGRIVKDLTHLIPLPPDWMSTERADALAWEFERTLPPDQYGRILAIDLLDGTPYLADTMDDLNRLTTDAAGNTRPTQVTRVGIGYYGHVRRKSRVDGPC